MIAAVPPAPDPAPPAHGRVHMVDYHVVVHAVDVETGVPIPGWWFRCRVPARWHGRLNVRGRMDGCVIFHR